MVDVYGGGTCPPGDHGPSGIDCPPERGSLRGEAGLIGLVEVMIASAMVVAALIVVYPAIQVSSSATANASNKVLATGLARQQLSAAVHQLQTDDSTDFPAPFTQCTASQSQGTAPLCQPNGTGASGPATQTGCADRNGRHVSCAAAEASRPFFTVTAHGMWVCQGATPGAPPVSVGVDGRPTSSYDQAVNGNTTPYFEVQITATWQGMIGNTGITMAQTVAPPIGAPPRATTPPCA